jgi:hypothetical protein
MSREAPPIPKIVDTRREAVRKKRPTDAMDVSANESERDATGNDDDDDDDDGDDDDEGGNDASENDMRWCIDALDDALDAAREAARDCSV